MIIHRLPGFVQGVFRPFRRKLSKPQLAHLQALLLGIVLTSRKVKLSHLVDTMLDGRHRTS